MTLSSLLAELRKRRVFRTLLIYIAVAWLIIQAVDIIGPALFLPAWSTTLVIVLLALGMPITVLLAWRFDIVGGEATRQASPEGRAATYIWLAFSGLTFVGGSWLAYYSYTETMAADLSVHESFGEYAPPDHSIAVLPFLNLSGNPDNEYFGDGLADTVLHRLAQVDELFVIARTSSFRFKGSNESVESIGRKLNVGAVLEGSVQQVGSRMRIIAQLIDARTGKHLQSLTFDATNDDIFAVQDEISLQVADALEIELLKEVTDKLTASGTDVPQAHDLYMLGRFYAGKYTPEGVRQGHEFFKQALTLDPTFVLAYVGVADTLIRSPQFEQVPGTVPLGMQALFAQQAFSELSDAERYSQAREALNMALELDGQSAEAHATLGYLETWLGDRSAAEPYFQKAIELRPGLADSHYVYGRFLAEEHRYAEARERIQKASLLDPANIPIIVWNMMFMRTDRETSEAAFALNDRIAELDPTNEFSTYRNPTIYSVAGLVGITIDRYFDAVVWQERELSLNPDLPANVMLIGKIYSDLGDVETAERWRALAAESPGLYDDHNGLSFNLLLLSRAGRYDEALALVEAVFGDSGHPLSHFIAGFVRAFAGQAREAVARFDAIPDPWVDPLFFSHEHVISNLPVFAVYYADALMKVGEKARAEAMLLEVRELVSFFRGQGYSTMNLDLMDAQVYAILGDHDEALASLRKIGRRTIILPVETDPIFEALWENPEFQEIAAMDDQHKAEQLEVLREHHRVPPPWSPDYEGT